MENKECLIIDYKRYPLPRGYNVTLSDNEKSYTLSVSTGEVRQDIYKRGYKVKLEYKNILQDELDQLIAIREATLLVERFSLILLNQAGDEVVYPLNLMAPIVPKWQSRRLGFNVYEKLSIELE